MAQVQHVRGRFDPYRVVREPLALGTANEAVTLHFGDEVSFDGHTLKYGDRSFSLPQFSGAVKMDWVVSTSDQDTGLQAPQPARLGQLALQTAEDHRSVSTIPLSSKAGAKESVSSEGTVVSTLRVPSQQKTLLKDTSDISAQIAQLDKTVTGRVTATPRTVTAAIAGDTLADIMPGMASSGVPEPGIAGEGAKVAAAERAAAERSARLRQIEGTPSAPEAKPSEADAKLALIRMSVPGFEWDLTVPWKSRVKAAVELHRSNPAMMMGILAVETDTVKKEILKKLSR